MSTSRDAGVIDVRLMRGSATTGLLTYGNLRFKCAIGRGGSRFLKREGDGATPLGCWQLRQVHYRGDRTMRPRTRVALRQLQRADGWCDAVGDRNYNRRIAHPYRASAEHMWRTDRLYDLVVELGYNDAPRVQGRGSAIFMHLARPGYTPTQGCIALAESDLRKLLAVLPARCAVRVSVASQ